MSYTPGVCNIGGAEVQRRKAVSKIGAILFILYSATALILNFSSSLIAISIFPALLWAVGYVQAKKKFCFAFGLLGTFNFAELGTISKVTDREAHAADRKMAIEIISQSLGLALLLTAALFLVARF